MNGEMNHKAYKALGDPTRLRIVQFLSQMCCGRAVMNESGGVYPGPTASEVCCQITGAEKITSTISHHLHELEAAGLIAIERRGKQMICSLRSQAFEEVALNLQSIARGDGTNACAEASDCEPGGDCCTPTGEVEQACC